MGLHQKQGRFRLQELAVDRPAAVDVAQAHLQVRVVQEDPLLTRIQPKPRVKVIGNSLFKAFSKPFHAFSRLLKAVLLALRNGTTIDAARAVQLELPNLSSQLARVKSLTSNSA